MPSAMIGGRRYRCLVAVLTGALGLSAAACRRDAIVGESDRGCTACGELPVFPGAEGFGSTTVAGRGGELLRVTTLADAGDGSLRWALAYAGPRIIVFEVSGTIELATDLVVAEPFVTVAGQSAPPPGIQLRGAGVLITTHDVLVQHLRIRYGDVPAGTRTKALYIRGESANVVVDHCTVMWASHINLDLMGTVGAGLRDVTVSNSLIAEGLAGMGGGVNLGCLAISGCLTRVSIVRNLLANQSEDAPRPARGACVVANNLVYNAGVEHMVIGDTTGSGVATVTAVGNHFLAGPATSVTTAIAITGSSENRVFLSDNLLSEHEPPLRVEDFTGTSLVEAPPIVDESLTVLPAAAVLGVVLATVGARPAQRDAVERRNADPLTGEVVTDGGLDPDSVAQAGGWPPEYDSPGAAPFAAPTDPNGDSDDDGYSNLEEVLHRLAAEVEGRL